MSRNRIEASHFSPDTQDFIRFLHRHNVHYVIVGGEAVIYYGYARLTGDVDFFYDLRPDNARRLFEALLAFWNGDIPGISDAEELRKPGLILQYGRPPNRIDLLNKIEGVMFDEAWPTRLEGVLVSDTATTPIYYIGLEQLIANKQAAGRPKDIFRIQRPSGPGFHTRTTSQARTGPGISFPASCHPPCTAPGIE